VKPAAPRFFPGRDPGGIETSRDHEGGSTMNGSRRNTPTGTHARTRSDRGEQGFTLIELPNVLAIVALVSMIAIPYLVGAMDKGKQTATVANIRQLSNALDVYAIEHDSYPRVESIEALAAVLDGDHLRSTPVVDGWGNPLVYECAEDGLDYTLTAVGKDGARQPEVSPGPIDSMEADIVFARGKFVQWPAGKDT
jgi:general secretion pathway protein G